MSTSLRLIRNKKWNILWCEEKTKLTKVIRHWIIYCRIFELLTDSSERIRIYCLFFMVVLCFFASHCQSYICIHTTKIQFWISVRANQKTESVRPISKSRTYRKNYRWMEFDSVWMWTQWTVFSFIRIDPILLLIMLWALCLFPLFNNLYI